MLMLGRYEEAVLSCFSVLFSDHLSLLSYFGKSLFHSMPWDWFEIRLSIILELAVYVKVGLFINLGFTTIEFILFEFRLDFSVVLLSLHFHPAYPTPLGLESPSGDVTLAESDLACESKSGSVGREGWYKLLWSLKWVAFVNSLLFLHLYRIKM